MTPEEAVIARLSTLVPVTALVASRIYQLKLPQRPTLPAIRVQLVGELTSYSHDGRDRVQRARIQVDAFAEEASGTDPYAKATQVAAAVDGNGTRVNATGLDGFQGGIGSPAFRIRAIRRIGGRAAGYESAEMRHVRIRQDYAVDFYG